MSASCLKATKEDSRDRDTISNHSLPFTIKMVVKKRLGSFDNEEYILPFANDASAEIKKTRALHETVGESSSSRFLSRFKSTRNEAPVLPTFTASCNPQGADVFIPTATKNTIVFTTRKRKTTALSFIAFGLVIFGIIAYSSENSTLRNILEQASSFNENRKTLLLKVRGAEKDVRMLEREVSALTNIQHRRLQEVDTLDSGEDHSISFKQLSELKAQLKAKNEHATGLQQRVKTLSHYEAMQKYGPGPHRVEIELEFPGETTPSSFVVEMAPLDVMPHSVDSFLGMVSAGLWDGCSFVMNAVHVIKAAPIPSHGNDAGEKLLAFEREGLNHLAFQEYSEDYPHKQYTLGFSGGDSPSWCVNTEDNTEIHSGDPCFATVVEGFDTIRKLGMQPTKDGIWYEQRVGIKRARVL